MTIGFVSAKSIIAKAYADLNLQQEARHSDFIEWIGEVARYMEAPGMFERKEETFKITNYRVRVPTGTLYVEWIIVNGKAMIQIDPVPGHPRTGRKGFSINPPCIVLEDYQTGNALVAYHGIRKDQDGYPLIPDVQAAIDACFYYILMKLVTPQLLTNPSVMNQYDYFKREWEHYADKAVAHMAMPTPAELEGIARDWNRMVPDRTSFDNAFIDKGNTQYNRTGR